MLQDQLLYYLDEEEEVGVLALGCCTMALLDVVVGDINTLQQR